LDRNLEGQDGLELIPSIRRQLPQTPVVLVTADTSVDTVVESIKAGAFDFVGKPLDEARLIATVAKAIDHHTLLNRIESLESARGDVSGFEELVGSSPQMLTVYGIIRNVAPTDVSVRVFGESGTGKELVTRAIHQRSDRASGPFVALNMASLPTELVESTLFGHEKGAFTGADKVHQGACEEADGGTLFLDEIADMPVELQPKLLRFLQEKSFRRVGGGRDRHAKVRVVSATNRDPLVEVHAGRMRLDLYYRLNVVPLELPPLREREGDILLLAQHFLSELSERYGKQFQTISDEAMQRLAEAPWPGNVRQLYHCVERAVVLHDGGSLVSSMLPKELNWKPADPSELDHGRSRSGNRLAIEAAAPATGKGQQGIVPLVEMEKLAIEDALSACSGSASQAAERLGISVATIYRKIKNYGLQSGPTGQTELPDSH
jgi:DNA-binding NtrC family response regulator